MIKWYNRLTQTLVLAYCQRLQNQAKAPIFPTQLVYSLNLGESFALVNVLIIYNYTFWGVGYVSFLFWICNQIFDKLIEFSSTKVRDGVNKYRYRYFAEVFWHL